MELDLEMQLLLPLDSDEDDLRELISDSEDGSDSDSATAQEEESADEAPRRKYTYQRAVKDIDSALDPANYDPWNMPIGDDEQHKVVLEKATRDSPEKSITWTSTQPPQTGRQNRANVLSGNPGVNRQCRDADSPVAAWRLLFTDDMVNKIVTKTNVRIQKLRSELPDEIVQNDKITYLHDTDFVELSALIGLIYARGLLGQNMHDIEKLFSERFGHPIFSATMGRNRFKFLMGKISFDDLDTRQERWKHDRFAAFREIHQDFTQKCMEALTPDDFLTLDETLYPMRTGVSFRQFNKNKPAKYGLLYKSLNSVRYPYTFVTHIYSGKPKDEPNEHYVCGTENTVHYLVESMLRHGELRGRNISVDRLYTSVSLADWLLERGVTIVGTMMANRKGVPAPCKTTDGREELSYKLWWNTNNRNMSMHSYVVRTKSTGRRNVIMLATMKPILGVTKDDGKKKPGIYKLYDFTKGGTDIVDQRSQSLTCKAKSNRWTMVAFAFLLDTCRVNSSTILAMNERKDPREVDALDFGWQLSESLVMPLIQQRSLNGLPITIQQKMEFMLGRPVRAQPQADRVQFDAKSETPRRCRTCIDASHGQGHKAAKKRMAKRQSQCQQCGEAVCQDHSVLLCKRCKNHDN